MLLTSTTTGHTVLGLLLQGFLRVLSGGFANSLPDVFHLFQLLATLELTICGLLWGFGHRAIVEDLVWKILGLSVLVWIITGWQPLLKSVMEGFIEAGLLAGSNVISMNDFTDPGNLIDFGFSVTAIAIGYNKSLYFWANVLQVAMSGIACMCIIGIYMILAAQIFKAILEFYLVGVCTFFLVPFLAFHKTAFIGERVFGTLIAHAVQLMVLALLLTVSLPILYNFKLPNEPGLQEICLLLGTSVVLLTLAIGAPSLANGMVFGTPSLHAGDVLRTAGSMGNAATALGGVVIAGGIATRAAISGASAMYHAANYGANNYRQAHPNSGGISSTIRGGAQGMRQYLTGTATQGLLNAVHNGRIRANRRVPQQP